MACGGSILSSDTILTAAHCPNGGDIDVVVAVVGDHNIFEIDGNEQRIPIKELIIHPKYNKSISYEYDLAIIKLAEPIIFTEYVGTICLPSVDKNYDNVTAKISGWGQSHHGEEYHFSDVLREVKQGANQSKLKLYSFEPRLQFKL